MKRIYRYAIKQIRQSDVVSEEDAGRQLKKYVVCLGLVGMLVLIAEIWIWTAPDTAEQLVLQRPEYGEEPNQYEIRVLEDQEETKINLSIQELPLSKKEIAGMFEEGFLYLEEIMLGENVDGNSVQSSLCFADTIPGLPLKVYWESSDQELIDYEGVLHNDTLQERTIVVVTAKLSYQEETQLREYPLVVCPRNISREEMHATQLEKLLLEEIEGQKTKQVFLPSQMGTMKLSFWNETDNRLEIALVLFLLPILVLARIVSVIRSKKQQRRDELIREYPLYINQLLLYLGAGMNVRNALGRLVTCQEKICKKPDYVAQELCYTLREMESGISETNAYRNMANRIGIPQYTRLANHLIRSVTKGEQNLKTQLEAEQYQLQTQRRDYAKKQGEVAGTRLLLPMMVLLVVVIAIIIYPAFVSFSCFS